MTQNKPFTGTREAQLLDAVNLLLDARRTGIPIPDLPSSLQPTSLEEALFVQQTMAQTFGETGGWKIGAPDASSTPIFAPMPAAWIAPGGASLAGITHRYRGVEAEAAFLLGKDLPARHTAYTLHEVLDALESCHPALEILESAYLDPETVAPLCAVADLQMHGGFVYGPACAEWRGLDYAREHVALAVDGSVRVERTGSNTSGNLLRLLPFLANEGAGRTGGLRAGQWITTGSWTGNIQAAAGSSVDAQFSTLGRVTARFARL